MSIRKLVIAVAGCAVAAVVFAAQGAVAKSLTTFEKLRRLERVAERHRRSSERLSREIARWDHHFRGSVQTGRLARRAVERVEAKIRNRLVGWEILHRRIRRSAYRWSPGEGRELRRLLERPERRSLQRHRDLYATVGKLRNKSVEPALMLRRRAELTVELAQHRATEDAKSAEKRDVIEGAREDAGGLEAEMQESHERLERSLENLIDHKTGEDFHRRKGALLPPVSADPAHAFGKKKQDDSMTYVRHTGVTYEVDTGTKVRAAADGLVVFAKRMEGYGNLVIIDHGDDYHSLYAHLEEMAVQVGQEVSRGGPVGRSGESDSLEGPKLYFELRHEQKPIDPTPWFVRQKESATPPGSSPSKPDEARSESPEE